MPTFSIFAQSDFPQKFRWQALGFMRVQWPEVFTGNRKLVTETYPAELEPIHFVAAEGDLLISYCSIFPITLRHTGNSYKAYGFGNMLTFPSFREEGHGGRVVELATDFIMRSGVDLGILFCDAGVEAFYRKRQWEVTRSPTRIGAPEKHEPHELLRLMLFASEKARERKMDFEERPFYIDFTW
jgi:predicted N-acetyltransferase YhbS